ncbi:SGNH/GDSL hydrolase N-terminal domain-containing protein, partial [Luteitalea sp.]|uniref:SGNH/GDSL hydrolase N-terminal domain-containing protein n=1 Tax=Luteitalea sp. TaxID=2004800 RepID=UPI0025B7F9AA
MTSAQLVLTMTVLAPGLAAAQVPATAPPVATTWHLVTPAMVDGKGWPEAATFERFPARAEAEVRPPVWGLSRHATGLGVRFTSTATRVRVRWTVTEERLALPHMPATGVSGLDLYQAAEKMTVSKWRLSAVVLDGRLRAVDGAERPAAVAAAGA